MDELDFAIFRFKVNFGWISYIEKLPDLFGWCPFRWPQFPISRRRVSLRNPQVGAISLVWKAFNLIYWRFPFSNKSLLEI